MSIVLGDAELVAEGAKGFGCSTDGGRYLFKDGAGELCSVELIAAHILDVVRSCELHLRPSIKMLGEQPEALVPGHDKFGMCIHQIPPFVGV